MKKLFLLAILLVLSSCEREEENVGEKNSKKTELFNKTTQNETNSSKTESDTIFVKSVSPAAETFSEDPIDEVDPKDIVPPKR